MRATPEDASDAADEATGEAGEAVEEDEGGDRRGFRQRRVVAGGAVYRARPICEPKERDEADHVRVEDDLYHEEG